MTYQTELKILIDACTKAAVIARKHAQNISALTVEHKNASGNSPVTEADLELDTFLKQFLCSARPDFGWLSEETADSKERLAKKAVWVVDPIDGTSGFLRGSEDYSISAALVVGDAPVAGVVYLPEHDAYIAAVGEVITHGTLPGFEPRTCLVSRTEYKAGVAPKIPGWNMQPFTSAATKIALVGAGLAEGTVQMRPKSEWDVAAAAAICRAGGVLLTGVAGTPFKFNQPKTTLPGVVAGEPKAHQELLDQTPNIPAPGYD